MSGRTGARITEASIGRKPRWVTVQTDTHRAFGSAGIMVEFDDTAGLPRVATRWQLVEGGAWTTADLRGVQRMLDEAFANAEMEVGR